MANVIVFGAEINWWLMDRKGLVEPDEEEASGLA
jgi:hypothetical protein